MDVERNRLETFAQWPESSTLPPDRLARAGFYYIGDGTDDKVECYSCHGRHEGWSSADVVMTVHEALFPHCRFVLDPMAADNVAFVNRPRGRSPARPSTDSVRPSVDGSIGSSMGYPDGSVVPLLPHNHVLGASYMPLSERLATFEHWPHDRPSSSSMADAGFSSAGEPDQVYCEHCQGRLHEWSSSDDPLLEHARHFPHCVFIQSLSHRPRSDTVDGGHDVYADPDTSVDDDGSPRSTARSRDASGASRRSGDDYAGTEFGEPPRGGPPFNDQAIRRRPEDEEQRLRQKHTPKALQYQSSVDRHLASVGVCTNRPVNASMANFHARLESFAGQWTHEAPRLAPEHMAAAGFFRHADDDKVKCFHCDGGLCNWTLEDDPFVQHAKWFSQCSFLRLVKGDDYIRQCREAPEANTKAITSPPSTPAPSAKHPCVVCLDAESSVVLLPCGHLCVCVNCAPPLDKCPICRQHTKALIRAFLP